MENQLNAPRTHRGHDTTASSPLKSEEMLGMYHKMVAKLLGRRDVDCDVIGSIGRSIGQVNSDSVELDHIS